jgi:hypothetical protein
MNIEDVWPPAMAITDVIGWPVWVIVFGVVVVLMIWPPRL